MKNSNRISAKNDITNRIIDMWNTNSVFLVERPWELESDRWIEFARCLFIEAVGIPGNKATEIVDLLSRLKLIQPSEISRANEDKQGIIQIAIVQRGIDPETSAVCSSLLTHAVKIATKKWKGHIQRLLRSHGNEMVDDIANSLAGPLLDRKAAARAATLWLQNVASMPILLRDNIHIKSFLKRHRITESDMLAIADNLDLNVGILDDILEIEHRKYGK